MAASEQYFIPFRKNIIGFDQEIETPFGFKKMVYADWIASGRLYRPIEEKMISEFGPFVGNTHSEASATGTAMTLAYRHAHKLIKEHVHASPDDIIITAGSGMTGVVNKFQRLLGLRVPEPLRRFCALPETERPVVFLTHMEHHSNHTSWLETVADVIILQPDKRGLVDTDDLCRQLDKYKHRTIKIGSFTAASNVTGIQTPYHTLAKIMHSYGGVCFIDFACSAPYVPITMHPEDTEERLDAVFFSPHKFLGGPGTPGVLIFNRNLYHNTVPDDPGGGTVDWTNPWGGYKFISDIESREDGGTPPFLQTIRAALALRLKEDMGTSQILRREEEIVPLFLNELEKIPGVILLADAVRDRLSVFSFYIENVHYNLVVKLLNDRFGIQVRGGCSCAGTYGHFLLHVDQEHSKKITEKIDRGDLSEKPGWVRVSLHPTMTNDEVLFVADAIREIVTHIDAWQQDYKHDKHSNEFNFCGSKSIRHFDETWFRFSQNENTGF